MNVFWVVGALLLVAALLFLLPPLLHRRRGEDRLARSAINVTVYRDQLAELERDLENDVISREQYEAGRQELEKRLLEDVEGARQGAAEDAGCGPSRGLALALGIAVPVLVIGLYLKLGNPDALAPERAAQQPPMAQMSESEISAQIERMVQQLAQRLEKEPSDVEGWKMLGRSYIVLRRFDKALAALEKALQLNDSDAQLLADYADALTMTSEGESLEGRPMEMIQRALKLDPNNEKALWLAGTAAYERADFAQALKYWKRLRDLVPPDSQAARTMESNIREAQALLEGRAPGADQAAVDESQGETATGAGGLRQVSGTVTLDDRLQGRAQPEDTVFVFARAPQGPPMPLAIVRARVKDLPLSFTLDDSKALIPSMTLSRFSRVEVVARISRSGDAMPRSGDLEGSSGVVGAGDEVRVVIDHVIP
ncbi:MAG TPA: c-type cytochrome biogenesis protein CcmI [Gammaproteobacteria bacterium]|nr:c-type cytochrome biogenesis protein CcmI [Gammaproteobacteria bacterium]